VLRRLDLLSFNLNAKTSGVLGRGYNLFLDTTNIPGDGMDIFSQDLSDMPVAPHDVRIRQFQVKPWPGGRRVSVYLELSPFQQNPNGEISVTNAYGDEVANLTIIETIDPINEFTIHLRGSDIKGEYTATINIFYTDPEQNDNASSRAQEGYMQLPSTRFMVVDQAQSTFVID
jgi:hypothetical protein